MVEIFKVQNSHPTIGQRIHTTEKPYKYECDNLLGFMRKFILDRSQIYMYLLVRSLEHEFILERFLTNFTSVKTKNKQTNKPYPHSSTSLQ